MKYLRPCSYKASTSIKEDTAISPWIYNHINNSILSIYANQYNILYDNIGSKNFNTIVIQYSDGETSKIPAPPGLLYTIVEGNKPYLAFTWDIPYFEEYLKESTYTLFFNINDRKTHILLNWENVCKVRYIEGIFIYEGVGEVIMLNSDMEKSLKRLLHVEV